MRGTLGLCLTTLSYLYRTCIVTSAQARNRVWGLDTKKCRKAPRRIERLEAAAKRRRQRIRELELRLRALTEREPEPEPDGGEQRIA